MTDGPTAADKPVLPSPRPAKRRVIFVTLAGVLAIVGALVAAYYFAMRPVTLRIAVGPANSDDLKVVQNLTQAFNNQRGSQVRLRPVQTEGATASATMLGEGKADLVALGRGMLYNPRWPWHAAAELGAEAAFPVQYQRAHPSMRKGNFLRPALPAEAKTTARRKSR